jgi:hypothetical protein
MLLIVRTVVLCRMIFMNFVILVSSQAIYRMQPQPRPIIIHIAAVRSAMMMTQYDGVLPFPWFCHDDGQHKICGIDLYYSSLP